MAPRRMIGAAVAIAVAGAAGCGTTDGDVVPRRVGTTTALTETTSSLVQQQPVRGTLADCRRFVLQGLRGLPIARAKRRANRSGCEVRVVSTDSGSTRYMTDDLRRNRIDVDLDRVGGTVVFVAELPVEP